MALFSQGLGKCNIAASAFEETAEQVADVTDRVKFQVTTVTPWTAEADYGQDGTVTFTLGANSGVERKISKSTPIVANNVELQVYEAFPFAIAVLDEVTILPGCNKQPGTEDTSGHCVNRYDNIVNLQAEHKISGPDKTTEVA